MTAAAAPHAEFDLTTREKVFTIVGTMLGLLLAALDQTIVATAGPAMQRDLDIAPSLYPWITTAYLVASTVMVPIYGKVSDLFGRKPILLAGIGIFLVGSLACGLSHTTGALIASRALQGAGSAALFTSAFAVVADIFAPADRGKYQGIFGAAFAFASVVGPFLGGFLTDTLSWHWVFFVNLPLGAIAIAFIVAKMPMLKRPRESRPRIDWAGAVGLLIAVVPFLVALSLGHGTGKLAWALVAVSLVGTIAFIGIERRAAEPLLDLRLFQNKIFALGNLATFTLGAAFLGGFVFLPLFMVNVVGLSATAAGLTLIPLTFGIAVGNLGAGQIVARIGKYRPVMAAGNVVLLCGFALLGFTLRPDSTMGEVTVKMVVLGLGLGPSIPLYTLAVQNAVEARDLGVATASVTFFRQIGTTVGVTVLGAAFALTVVTGLRAIRPSTALAGVDPPTTKAGGSGEQMMPVQLQIDVPGWRAASEARFVDVAQRQAAFDAIEELDRATKRAVTDATKAIYRFGMLLALAGLVFCLWIPQIPLRKAEGRVAVGD